MEWDCRNCLFSLPRSARVKLSPVLLRLIFFLYFLFIFLSPTASPSFHALHFFFSPDVSPFLDFFPSSLHISFSLCLFPLPPSLLPSPLSSFPLGLPVWYSTCVAGRQDGLEHGQAPQTTLIYRTAFQSLLQCCSTYINTSMRREPQSSEGGKEKS